MTESVEDSTGVLQHCSIPAIIFLMVSFYQFWMAVVHMTDSLKDGSINNDRPRKKYGQYNN